MARRLLDGGYEVWVRDIGADARGGARSGRRRSVPPTGAELARRCAVVIVAVVDAAQCDEVLFGPVGAARPAGAAARR